MYFNVNCKHLCFSFDLLMYHCELYCRAEAPSYFQFHQLHHSMSKEADRILARKKKEGFRILIAYSSYLIILRHKIEDLCCFCGDFSCWSFKLTGWQLLQGHANTSFAFKYLLNVVELIPFSRKLQKNQRYKLVWHLWRLIYEGLNIIRISYFEQRSNGPLWLLCWQDD